ncbi:Uncharacterised protein [Vibrio cholerae]|uniref:Uncharacterized protein n=1 Tax=Vibrio cholerae TaxID=666 RepID=A0A655PUE5_VIBCL|nr:Uncharacterised protein [Vibrio cholerae]CSA28932.1 Uncharacterised protein [Vibrio cholerae]CSC65743.1 Uncharacterised protein [Vibrio cholerae]
MQWVFRNRLVGEGKIRQIHTSFGNDRFGHQLIFDSKINPSSLQFL